MGPAIVCGWFMYCEFSVIVIKRQELLDFDCILDFMPGSGNLFYKVCRVYFCCKLIDGIHCFNSTGVCFKNSHPDTHTLKIKILLEKNDV